MHFQHSAIFDQWSPLNLPTPIVKSSIIEIWMNKVLDSRGIFKGLDAKMLYMDREDTSCREMVDI